MIITIELTFEFVWSEPNRSDLEHRFMVCFSADMFSNSERTSKILVYLKEFFNENQKVDSANFKIQKL